MHWYGYLLLFGIPFWLLTAWIINRYACGMADRPVSLRERLQSFPMAMIWAIPGMLLAIPYGLFIAGEMIWAWLTAGWTLLRRFCHGKSH